MDKECRCLVGYPMSPYLLNMRIFGVILLMVSSCFALNDLYNQCSLTTICPSGYNCCSDLLHCCPSGSSCVLRDKYCYESHHETVTNSTLAETYDINDEEDDLPQYEIIRIRIPTDRAREEPPRYFSPRNKFDYDPPTVKFSNGQKNYEYVGNLGKRAPPEALSKLSSSAHKSKKNDFLNQKLDDDPVIIIYD